MPINHNLPVIPLPMTDRFNTPINSTLVNDLQNIKIRLVNHTRFEDILDYIPGFVEMTWEDKPWTKEYSIEQIAKSTLHMFRLKTLPTALETIRLTFLIDGINFQDVTHLIRHRTFSFSSSCTGDRDQRNQNITVPEAIQNSPEFYARYEKLMRESVQLYADMVDSKQISLMDARLCLPKAHDTAYYASCNLGDLIRFLNQRKDEDIQPASDNIMALKMYLELCKAYPIACLDLVKFDVPNMFYVHAAKTTHSTRLYAPSNPSDIFEWNPESNIYGDRKREEVSGTNGGELKVYAEMKAELLKAIEKYRGHSKDYWESLGQEV